MARDIDRAERGLDPAAGSDGAVWDVFGAVGWPDRRIGKLAEPQRSLITRRQLFGLGVSSDMIDRALKRGRLHRLHLRPFLDGDIDVTVIGSGAGRARRTPRKVDQYPDALLVQLATILERRRAA